MTTSDQESSSDIALRLVGCSARSRGQQRRHTTTPGRLLTCSKSIRSTLEASRPYRRPGQQNNGWRSWTNSPPALKPPIAVTPVRKSNGSLGEWPVNGSSNELVERLEQDER